MRWVIGIVVVAVLVFLGYRYFGSGGEQIAERAEQAGEQAAETAQQATDEAAEAAGEVAEQAADTAEQAADTAQQAAETAGQAAEEAAQATGEAAEQAADTAGQAAEEAAQAAGEAAEETADAAEDLAQSAALTVGDINLGKEVTDVVDRASDALSGITDAASAEAALPALNEVRTKLDDLTATVDQLPEEARTVLAGAVSGLLPKLQTLVDQVSSIEGAGEVVKPAVEPIMAKLDAWAKQPA